MNAHQLRDAIGKIDDKYIAEAETFDSGYSRRRTVFIISSVSAAAIAVCVCVNHFTSLNNPHQFEINNSYVVTTVSETAAEKTEVSDTEISDINTEKTEVSDMNISDINTEKTEVSDMNVSDINTEKTTVSDIIVSHYSEISEVSTSGTSASKQETGYSSAEKTIRYESSTSETKVIITNSETSSEKTENTFTSPPVTAVTQKPSELTTDSERITESYTSSSDITTVYSESESSINPLQTTIPRPQTAIPTEYNPLATPAQSTFETSSAVTTSEHFIPDIYSFPLNLKDSEGRVFHKCAVVKKNQTGEFIQRSVFSDLNGNQYFIDEYSLKDVSSDMMRVMYFEKTDSYVAYYSDSYNPDMIEKYK